MNQIIKKCEINIQHDDRTEMCQCNKMKGKKRKFNSEPSIGKMKINVKTISRKRKECALNCT